MPIKNTDCAATYKVLIVGDSGVGKSAILNCLMGKKFDDRWRPTVGVDFVTKIIEADGALIELRIWDTAGLETFRSMTRRQFQGVQGVFLVYDVASRISFDSLSYWMAAIPNVTNHQPSPYPSRRSYEPIPFIILGNKLDKMDERKVDLPQGLKLANSSMAFGFYETSAKTGSNIFEAVHKMAFTITDINHPRLMKSYHRHQIRPFGTKDDVMSTSLSSSNLVTMRQRSVPASSASSPSSKVSSSSSPFRRHTLSVLPFSILRAKTKAIKKNSKQKRTSWSFPAISFPSSSSSFSKSEVKMRKNKSKKKDFAAKRSNKTNRNTFSGWGTNARLSIYSTRYSEDNLSGKCDKRKSRNFSSNTIMAESSVGVEREKDVKGKSDVVRRNRKSKKKNCGGLGTLRMLFSCFRRTKKRKRES